MANPWLPTWLVLAWTAVFAMIVAVHLWHVAVMTGRDRLWHWAHVLSATGMIVMFLPVDAAVPYRAGVAIFAMAAMIVTGLLGREVARRRSLGRLWPATVIDLAAMAYMFAMMSTRVVWLTVPLVGWFLLQVAGWSTGRLCTALAAGGLGGPQPTLAAAAPAAHTVIPGATGGPRGGAAMGAGLQRAGLQEASLHPVPGRDRHHSRAHRTAIRFTLALMSLGMAYMLLAMQLGMATMPAMAGR